MNRNLRCAMVLSWFLVPGLGAAQIAVEILDTPPTAYSYEPVWVTFEVRNEGPEPLVIPADTCTQEGAFLEVGLRGERLEDRQIASDCAPHRLVWLTPGGRWLFYQPVALGPEGVFDIEAVLRSPGECQGSPVGPERHRIQPVRPIVWGARPYDCWSGEARSQRSVVTVETPSSKVDLAAMKTLGVDHVSSPRTLHLNLRRLLELHPTSHYTYAASWFAVSALGMLDVVVLQPENPLNPWVAGAMAENLASRNRRCNESRSEPPGIPAELAKRYAKVIAAYPPPASVKGYLRQQALEHAAEECPKGKAEEGEKKEKEKE